MISSLGLRSDKRENIWVKKYKDGFVSKVYLLKSPDAAEQNSFDSLETRFDGADRIAS